ncbi:hypothetical protein EDD66_10426 [Mobilisporobacter senegalensis]|uniref:Membrane protein YczE n=1 Tax=Mobilisporobacter senegalensis TaxID=1329262 RepID=A0A3N1XP32_9FIRM|nr:hypothetical protein [Mobilisporobacter senegalensis]ROR28444.1 hypothetical protein EDD66_10426 [Mobilisporobacter senegalensis]
MKNINLFKLLMALLGIFLIGAGVAFNAATQLGNDPIGIIYDGVRNALGLTPGQLGLVSNFVNYGLIALLFFVGRKYVNIGTLIYILPYGFFVNAGNKLYAAVIQSNDFSSRMVAGIIGCLFIYTGVAIYISMDMGLDPFTGIVMVIRDKIKLDFKKTKICFDIIMVIFGVILGGKLGIITVFTALTAGPSIQFISNKITGLMKLYENRKMSPGKLS